MHVQYYIKRFKNDSMVSSNQSHNLDFRLGVGTLALACPSPQKIMPAILVFAHPQCKSEGCDMTHDSKNHGPCDFLIIKQVLLGPMISTTSYALLL